MELAQNTRNEARENVGHETREAREHVKHKTREPQEQVGQEAREAQELVNHKIMQSTSHTGNVGNLADSEKQSS